jgi:phage shock protein PspC (stress-responsive transcriptional regulator)
MKETTTINISGIIFHIDLDAYERLKAYFQELKKRFGDNEEGKEIINDIELRIAEILQEKLTDKKQVVSIEDVDNVIETMGHPEDFESDSEEEEKAYKEEPRVEFKEKALYRDPDNTVLGGVCSGLGHYFGLDPVIIRVITVLFTIFYGVGLLIYIILWAFIPKATTTAQKLEMKGQPVTAENIKKTIKKNYEEVKNSGSFQKAKEGINKGANAAGEVVHWILKAIIIIIGVGLVIGAVTSIVALVNLMFFHSPTVYFNGEATGVFFPVVEAFFESRLTMIILIVSSILLALIPIMLILFLGVKIVFRFKTNNKLIGFGSLAVWLIALAAVITIGIQLGSRYTYPADVESETVFKEFEGNSMVVKLSDYDPEIESIFDNFYISSGDDINTSYIFHRPDFDVRQSENDYYSLRVLKEARGRNNRDAREVAEDIEFNFELKDSILSLDQWYRTSLKNVGRIEDLDITLYIPVGKKVFFNGEILPIVYDIDNVHRMYDGDMMNKRWIMKPEGLTLIEKIKEIKKTEKQITE